MNPAYRFASVLLFGALTSCGARQSDVEISFVATNADQLLQCDDASTSALLGDLRFFVQDLFLIDANGKSVALQLAPDGQWQDQNVALIDLEDGRGTCQNGTAAVNSLIKGHAPSADYRGLQFTLGVPGYLNHGDPLLAEAPLTDAAMHWHWRSGYKFLRAALQRDGQRMRLHLGSARCHGVIGKLQGCDEGNRPTVVLHSFNFERDVVAFDFAALLANVEQGSAAVQVCEMGPDEELCTALRPALGLNEDGQSIAPSAVFRAMRAP